MSTRWLVLAFFNLLFLIYTTIQNKNIFLLQNRSLLSLLALLLVSLASISFSTNFSESLLFTSKILIILTTLYNLSICAHVYKRIKNDIIIILIISLIIEVSYIIFYSSIYGFEGVKGISMNPNISSFSILMKLPVLLFAQQIFKILKKYLIFLEIFILLSLFILGSRASVLIVMLVYTLYFFININYKKIRFQNFIRLGLIPLFIFINSIYLNPINSNGSQSLSNDQSILLRLDYYKIAIESITENFWFGTGAGSWKVESLGEFNQTLNETIVPYYTHNDFIQFFYELGILGFIAYIIFIISFYFMLIRLKLEPYEKFFIISLLVYTLDSLINFPFHRPQEIITLLLVSAPILRSKIIEIQRINKPIFCVFIILIISSIYIQLKEHNSLKLQNILISDASLDAYSLDVNQISDLDTSLPNISANTVPLDTYLSRYYLKEEDYQNALYFSLNGYKINPYLKYTKEQYIKALLLNQRVEEALEISRLLYDQEPSNNIYSETYLSLLIINSRLVEIESLFFNLVKYNQENIIEKLLIEYSNFKISNGAFFKDAIQKSLNIYPNNTILKQLSEEYLKN